MALIDKDDLSLELQITFDAGYTDQFFLDLSTWAEDMLKLKTNRLTFTGSSESVAKAAAISIAIDRLATSNRSIISSAIQSISENGASIVFSNSKTLASYRDDFQHAIADLRIPSTSNYAITQTDFDDLHTGEEGNILY